MKLAVDVRSERGELLGTVPMERDDWFNSGDFFRFWLAAPMNLWEASNEQATCEQVSITLYAQRWGRRPPYEWVLKAPASDIEMLARVVGFRPASAIGEDAT